MYLLFFSVGGDAEVGNVDGLGGRGAELGAHLLLDQRGVEGGLGTGLVVAELDINLDLEGGHISKDGTAGPDEEQGHTDGVHQVAAKGGPRGAEACEQNE